MKNHANIITGKHTKKIALISLSLIVGVFVLLLMSIHSDLYPNSSHVQPKKFSQTSYNNQSVYGSQSCHATYWGISAQADKNQQEISEYYSSRWVRENRYITQTNVYYLLTIASSRHGIFIVKHVYFPEGDKIPLKYTIETHIEFCAISNWSPVW